MTTSQFISKEHKLTRTETGRKSGKYHYQVINKATGEVVSERTSNREYQAASLQGNWYFGRPDLIGGGSHGQYYAQAMRNHPTPEIPEVYLVALLED